VPISAYIPPAPVPHILVRGQNGASSLEGAFAILGDGNISRMGGEADEMPNE
jgi:hypothetical protein